MEQNNRPDENYANFSVEEIQGKSNPTEESNDETPKQEDGVLLSNLYKKNMEAQLEENPINTHKIRKKKKTSKKSRLKRTIWMTMIFLISIALALTLLVFMSDVSGVGKEIVSGNEHVLLQVEEGTSIVEISELLEDNGLVINKDVFRLYLKFTKKGGDISYGAHDLTKNMGYSQIIDVLSQPAKAEDISVTVKSGASIDEIAAILDEKGICKKDDFIKEIKNGEFEGSLIKDIPNNNNIYYALEGYLFPDTYSFYHNDNPHRVIQKMIDNTEEKITPDMNEKAKEKGYTIHEVLTMASIVELESCGYYNEMPKVAAVFYNRLNKWPEGSRYLQSDPTMNYKYGNDSYNTYKSEGLPPGPLCNVTEKAIQAAFDPDESCGAFFFVTDKFFNFYYNETNEEHNATVQDLISRGMWLEE